MNRFFKISILIILGTTIAHGQTVCEITSRTELPGGNTVGVGTQIWNFVTNNNKFPIIRGNLLAWHINRGDVWDDWDLCIFVQPNNEYLNYSYNTYNNINPPNQGHIAGNIELEIQTLAGGLGDNPTNRFLDYFSNLFQLNSEVETFGLWVQDWGHSVDNPKTELHPLIYMKQNRNNQTSIFIGRDISGRFCYDPGAQQLEFPLNYWNLRGKILATNTVSTITSSATLIKENSAMDISTNKRSDIWRAVVQYPLIPKFQIAVSFGEPNSVGKVNLNQGHYHPFYLGNVTITNPEYFSSTVRYNVKTCSEAGLDPLHYPPQAKVVEITIEPTLTGEAWDISWWKATKYDPIRTQSEEDYEKTEKISNEANTWRFVRYYAPGLSLNDNKWLLATTAATSRYATTLKPPRMGEGPSELTYIYKEMVYEIPASKVDLDLPCAMRRQSNIMLYEEYQLHIDCPECDSALFANVTTIPEVLPLPSTIKWLAKPIRDMNGNIDYFGEGFRTTELQANTSWTWQGVTLKYEQSNPYRLLFNVDATANKTLIEITFRVDTEIGEHLSAVQNIPIYGACVLRGGPIEYIEDIIKAEYALEYLRERGLINDPMTMEFSGLLRPGGELGPEGGLPWPTNQHIAILREPYDIIPKLSGDPRKALEAFYKMAGGTELSNRELGLLARFIIEGSKIRWTNQPPSDAFETLKRMYNSPQRSGQILKNPFNPTMEEIRRTRTEFLPRINEGDTIRVPIIIR